MNGKIVTGLFSLFVIKLLEINADNICIRMIKLRWRWYFMATLRQQDSLVMANFVIDLSIQEENLITNVQLQKILFFLQGYSLQKYSKPILADNFSKWQYGPVIEKVYQEFKSNGSEKISDKAVEIVDDCSFFNIKEYGPLVSDDLGGKKNFEDIECFVKNLIMIDPWELVKMTHDHLSWKNYEPRIINHEYLQYTNAEIRDCFNHNKERLPV